MSWNDIGKIISKSAPLLGSILTGNVPGAVSSVGSLIADFLGVANNPEGIEKVLSERPELALKLKELELQHQRELISIRLRGEGLLLEQETARVAEVHKTIRAEIQSDNAFKSSWRPFFGYAVAVSWFLQMSGFVGVVAYIAIAEPNQVVNVISALGTALAALSVLWGVALGVLGINIGARSRDKAELLGDKSPSLLDKIVSKVLK